MSDKISHISFPGLGIGEFTVHSVAFTLFGRPVMWYGIILTLGIIAGFAYAMYRSKFEKIKTDDVLDYAIWCVISAVVCARLYYVVTYGGYKGDTFGQTLYNIVAVWEGGLAIYGAIIGGAIAAIIVSRVKKIKLGKALDMIAPGVMLGQVIGRFGNFVNAEAFGEQTTLPWRMGIRNRDYLTTIYVHPTFLYESLWNLIGFIIINAAYKKKKFDGQILLMYVGWYGFGRMFIEGLRTDSLYVGSVRISQLVGFLSFVIATALLIVFSIRAKKSGGAEVAMTSDATASAIESASGPEEKSESSDPKENNDNGDNEDGKNN